MSYSSKIAEAFRLDVDRREISGVFSFQVQPTFRKTFTLWIIAAERKQIRENETKGWIKAAIEVGDSIRVIKVDKNPLEPCLRAIDLVECDNGPGRDGVSYELNIQTPTIQGVLRFANPETNSLRRIVSAMYSTAASIAQNCPQQIYGEVVNSWGRSLGNW